MPDALIYMIAMSPIVYDRSMIATPPIVYDHSRPLCMITPCQFLPTCLPLMPATPHI